MKKVSLYEFKDLSEDTQEKVIAQDTEVLVELDLMALSEELERGDITEEQYYEIIGCSKSYADCTAWFVPSCYYDNNKEQIDKSVKENVVGWLYTENGTMVQRID